LVFLFSVLVYKGVIIIYKITKLVNNNFVCSLDSDGNEIILRGLGIGFKKKKNDLLEKNKVEKIYRISNQKTSNKLQELIAEIPINYFNICTEIIEYAKKELNKKLNDNIYITLTDHISFAIERKNQNLEFKNALLLEIKRFYTPEYQIGIKSLEIIKQKLGIDLAIDEAGFIALHIVNAQLDTNMQNTFKITELIQNVLKIVRLYYKIELDEESLHYERFITHLKFFSQRLFSNNISKDDDKDFQEMVKKSYEKDFICATKIRTFIEGKYKKKVTDEELIFLTVHLRKITN
jgi:beta-glucoside operon transcriptional antiterminator